MRRNLGREICIGVVNKRQDAADWRMQGRNAIAAEWAQMFSGLLGAGPSLFDLNG